MKRHVRRGWLGLIALTCAGLNGIVCAQVATRAAASAAVVTPAAVVKLLRYMYGSPARADWISLLPVGGLDGTLSSRFGDGPATGRIHAKTGSLSHVSALSDYAERRDGRWVGFSVLVNNYNGTAADIRGVMDRICALIME